MTDGSRNQRYGQQWHTLSAAEAAGKLGVEVERGLSAEQVHQQLAQVGPNQLRAEKSEPIWRTFLEELREPMVLLLLFTGVLYAIWGEPEDALVIFSVILVLNTIEVYNEQRARKAIASLHKLAAPSASVRREGHYDEVPVEQIVPGDVILLQAGRRVPADARLVDAYGLSVDESSLTGESVPVDKDAGALFAADAPLAERRNMLFAGTAITRGRGTALVVATGAATELGRVAGMARVVKPPRTPLQIAMRELTRSLVWIALGFSVLIPALGLLSGQPFEQMLLTGLSLAFATIPEEMPIIITMVLALGGYRLSKQNAIVKRLQSVETLGAVTVIATDKTGTLTENRMQVSAIYPPECAHQLLTLGALCNDAVDTGSIQPSEAQPGSSLLNSQIPGDSLDIALLRAAQEAGLDVQTLRQTHTLRGEFTFDNARKLMSVVYTCQDGFWVIAKGAPESILARSAATPPNLPLARGGERLPALPGNEGPGVSTTPPNLPLPRGGECQSPLPGNEGPGVSPTTPHSFPLPRGGASPSPLLDKEGLGEVDTPADEHRAILHAADDMARQGLRVIAFAQKVIPAGVSDITTPSQAEAETGLCFAGLVGFADPPRPEVKAAIAACRAAGIRPIMITGDHPLTARAIASQIGLDGDGGVITGADLDRLPDEALQTVVNTVSIYARTTPEHKLRIVHALHERGERVAVTGDGINDAPALAAADIGIAMGETGTDVAREAGDMVLADDNFATIVRAVEEGRVLFANLRKGVGYYLACKVALVAATLLPVLLRVPVPFAPVQIILMELFMDLAASATFVAERGEAGLMRRSPRNPRARFMDRAMITRIFTSAAGLFAAVSVAYLTSWFGGRDVAHAQTVAFVTWLLGHVALAINMRSDREPLLKIGLFTNRLMVAWALATVLFVLAATSILPVQALLKTATLSGGDWALAIGAALAGTFWIEMRKEIMG